MNKPQKSTHDNGKKAGQIEEIKVEGPLSEKDEVKAAERKMAKNLKRSTEDNSK